jgi:hypothetical protein
MKPTIIIIAIFTIIYLLPTHAQTVLEFQAGLNVASLSDPGNLAPTAVWNTRTGFIGAVSTNFGLSDEFSINSGLRFVQKGMKSEFFWPTEGMIRGTLTLNYLEVPVYIKFKIADLGTRLFVFGGPTFSYLLHSKQEANSDLHGDVSGGSDAGIKYKNYDASVDVGLSTQTPFSADLSILATAFYSYGLVKISDTISDGSGWSMATNTNEKTRDIRVMIGVAYLFN